MYEIPRCETLSNTRRMATWLGVPQKWLRLEAKAGRLPAVPIGANDFLFDREAVVAALKASPELKEANDA